MTHSEIQEEWLSERDLFGVRYKEGTVFLEVDEYEDTELDDFTPLEDIEGGTSLDNGYQRLQDSNNDDVIYVGSDDENIILHVGIGIAPSQIEMYPAYPSGTRQFGEIPNVSTLPTPGSNIGGVSGNESPYSSPSTESELVIPPKQHVEFDFQNRGDDTHEPVLRILMRKYRVNVLNPNNSDDLKAIKRIVEPGRPMPIKSAGSLRSKAEYNMRDEWNVRPMTRQDVRGR